MAREHISARMDTDTLAGVDAWATGRGLSRSTAIAELCRLALGMKEQPDASEAAQGEIDAMRAHIATLTEQLKVKDAQIASLTELADHAQRLHAMSSQTLPAAAHDGQDVPTDDSKGERRGFWARLFGQ